MTRFEIASVTWDMSPLLSAIWAKADNRSAFGTFLSANFRTSVISRFSRPDSRAATTSDQAVLNMPRASPIDETGNEVARGRSPSARADSTAGASVGTRAGRTRVFAGDSAGTDHLLRMSNCPWLVI